jgi:nucleoside-diphosphate-sugar epimerase
MKILVTGAIGFIGGAVARKLSQQGHEVLGLSQSDAAAAKGAERCFAPSPPAPLRLPEHRKAAETSSIRPSSGARSRRLPARATRRRRRAIRLAPPSRSAS